MLTEQELKDILDKTSKNLKALQNSVESHQQTIADCTGALRLIEQLNNRKKFDHMNKKLGDHDFKLVEGTEKIFVFDNVKQGLRFQVSRASVDAARGIEDIDELIDSQLNDFLNKQAETSNNQVDNQPA